MATGKINSNGWKLLWTNPNPSSDFTAQTIPLDLSKYSEFVVSLHQWKADTAITSQFRALGYVNQNHFSVSPILSNGQVYLAARTITITSTGVAFGNAGSKTSMNSNFIQDNGWFIPTKIWAK